jgi:hypothetical protein
MSLELILLKLHRLISPKSFPDEATVNDHFFHHPCISAPSNTAVTGTSSFILSWRRWISASVFSCRATTRAL